MPGGSDVPYFFRLKYSDTEPPVSSLYLSRQSETRWLGRAWSHKSRLASHRLVLSLTKKSFATSSGERSRQGFQTVSPVVFPQNPHARPSAPNRCTRIGLCALVRAATPMVAATTPIATTRVARR